MFRGEARFTLRRDGTWDMAGVSRPGATVHADRDWHGGILHQENREDRPQLIVLRVPGYKYWSGLGQPWRYMQAMTEVWEVLELGPEEMRLRAVCAFPVASPAQRGFR